MKILIIAMAVVIAGCASASADQPPQPPTQGDPCAMKPGTFEVTAEGFVEPAPTGVVIYKLYPCDKKVDLFFPLLSGQSNSTSFTIGPLPTLIVPKTIMRQSHMIEAFDNSIEKYVAGLAVRAGDPQIVLGYEGGEQSWSPYGQKGFGEQVVTIFLD